MIRVFTALARALVTVRHAPCRQGRLSVRQGSNLLRVGRGAATCCAGLLFGLILAPAGPAGAAVISLTTTIASTAGAFDNDSFPQVGARVECQPVCAPQQSRNDAVRASILTSALSGHQNFRDASMFIEVSGRVRVGDLSTSIRSVAADGGVPHRAPAAADEFSELWGLSILCWPCGESASEQPSTF